ncbi:MAG: ABC transporter ATP-binding protein [Thermoguttaceae bacterium]|nr:ABC transporter ATP-binding protein [Planctomycetaceae bacterium]MBQ4143184.1 ABC transporter ATP-binding protein [Thermoguttaceae bacterium]
MEIMQVRGLKKSFTKGPHTIPVLKGIDLDVHEGEYLSIIGQSGSGKSTLLHVMGLLTHPNEGSVIYRGNRIDDLPDLARDRLRNHDISMIFQFYHLLPELDIVENVLTPMMIAQGYWKFRLHRKAHRERAKELLERVGLGHRLKHRPSELSGGEMQRTAIARALINQPKILLADEPTGNLDRSTEGGIIELLRELNETEKLTIVLVTHNPAIAAGADRTVTLTDGLFE